MKSHRPRLLRPLALLAGIAFTGGLHAATVLIDDFNYSLFTEQTYWSRIASSGDPAFVSPVGTAVLRGRMTQSEYTATTPNGNNPQYSVIVSNASDTRYNFFTESYTVNVTDIALTTVNLDLNQAFLRIGLSSSAVRQFTADDAITMRIRYNNDGLGGLLLFGYKMNQTSADAEVRIGASTTAQSLNSVNFSGTIQSAGFTLDTVGFAGSVAEVAYTVNLTTSAQTYSVTGTMFIDQTQWGDGSGFSALAIESRRNGNTGYSGVGDSDARLSIGAVTYTPVPEPASFAALAGLGMLGFAASRRRRQG